jgi:hypothetical protein
VPKPALPLEALVDLRHRLGTLSARSAARRQVIQEVAAVYAVSEARYMATIRRKMGHW